MQWFKRKLKAMNMEQLKIYICLYIPQYFFHTFLNPNFIILKEINCQKSCRLSNFFYGGDVFKKKCIH